MRNRFDTEMQRLHTMLIEMGALCESAIASAIKALLEGDAANARRAVDLELDINQLERDVEELCYKLLLRQQPVARDLRQVSSALKMITDMERIGDQAADIAEIAAMGNACGPQTGLTIREMSLAAIGMVTDSIDAYVNQDVELAYKVIRDDDIVDDLFVKVRGELAATMAGELKSAEYAIDLLMVAKYLERIGDHAVNIAQWVVFAITGRHIQEAEVKGEGDGDDLSG